MLKNDIFLAQNGPLETDFAQRRDCQRMRGDSEITGERGFSHKKI